MEFVVACQMILGMMNNQSLTVADHQKLRLAYETAAPKCMEAVKSLEAKEAKKK